MRDVRGRAGDTDDNVRARVRGLLQQYGWNVTSFQTLEPGFSYFFHGDDACVAFVDTGAAWVAGGAPLAPLARMAEVAGAFVEAARRAGRRASFFATEQRFVDAAGWPSLCIGEQASWDPRAWDEALARSRSLREQLRRARAKGVVVERVEPSAIADPSAPARLALDALVRRWSDSRAMAPMGFLVQLHILSFLDDRRIFLARHGGRPVAFLAAVPICARQGWFLEDIVRDPAASNGTAELLVDAALRAAAAEGATLATLGLSPLSGARSRWLRFARAVGRSFYDFAGVRAFKEKLRPRAWEPVYLSFPPSTGSLSATWDALTAFARGDVLGFGLSTLSRGPVVVMSLLGALLLPWTALLAVAPSDEFPAPTLRWAWVVYDLLLAAGLLALGRRWRPGLARLLHAAVAGDAVVTVVEALLWNAPRAHRGIEWLLLGCGVLAPAAATWLLWRARAHRSASHGEELLHGASTLPGTRPITG